MDAAAIAFERLVDLLHSGNDNSLSSGYFSKECNRYRVIIDCNVLGERDDWMTSMEKMMRERYRYAGQVSLPVE